MVVLNGLPEQTFCLLLFPLLGVEDAQANLRLDVLWIDAQGRPKLLFGLSCFPFVHI